MKTLLDTDVLSEARKPAGDAGVRRALAEAEPDDLFISVISIGEITSGIAWLETGARRRELEAWLAVAEHHFADRILPIDRDIAQLWGEITAKARKAGQVIHAADGLIAATGIHHGLRIMTRNIQHFEATGALLSNPWEG